MAATVQIRQYTGAGPTQTDKTSGSIVAGTSDELAASNLRVPSSGSNYSYWLTTGLYCTVAADNALNNIKWYSDGTNTLGTGVDMVVTPASAYVQSVGTAGSSGSVLNLANHLGASAVPVAYETYTSGAKLTIAGSTDTTTGCFGDFLVMQVNIESTAGAGNTGEETLTWQWDES